MILFSYIILEILYLLNWSNTVLVLNFKYIFFYYLFRQTAGKVANRTEPNLICQQFLETLRHHGKAHGWAVEVMSRLYMSQCRTKPTIRRVTSKDSDQPAHPRSLIRVFADHMYLIQPLDYPKRDKKKNLAKLGGYTGWSESLMVTQVLL